MRGAGQCDFAVSEAKRISRPGFHQRQRLYGLDGRTWEHWALDIAYRQHAAAIGIDYNDCATMTTFHDVTAHYLNQSRIRHCPATPLIRPN